MAFWTWITLNENGEVSSDDGVSAWDSTLVAFTLGERRIVVDVHVDSYSGKSVAVVKQDDVGFPVNLLGRLAIRLYWLCGKMMREVNTDVGQAECDLEAIVISLFYRGDTERMLRKIRSAATAGEGKSRCLVGKP